VGVLKRSINAIKGSLELASISCQKLFVICSRCGPYLWMLCWREELTFFEVVLERCCTLLHTIMVHPFFSYLWRTCSSNQKGGFHWKQLLVPEFSNVYLFWWCSGRHRVSGSNRGSYTYIHTVHITLPLMAKFKRKQQQRKQKMFHRSFPQKMNSQFQSNTWWTFLPKCWTKMHHSLVLSHWWAESQ
jgi:hypothetical protein